MTSKFAPEIVIINEALAAAAKATKEMIIENPGVWFPCGYVHVKIKPARGRLVSALKELELGNTCYEGGYDVHNPSGNCTQWMDAKVAGARAFQAVLAAHGHVCTIKSRMD